MSRLLQKRKNLVQVSCQIQKSSLIVPSSKLYKKQDKPPTLNYFQKFSDNFNSISNVLKEYQAKNSSGTLPVATDQPGNLASPNTSYSLIDKFLNTKNQADQIIGNFEWSKYRDFLGLNNSGPNRNLSDYYSDGEYRTQLRQDKVMQEEIFESEKQILEQINEERFYQRVALSKHTQKLLEDLETNLKLVTNLDTPSKITEYWER